MTPEQVAELRNLWRPEEASVGLVHRRGGVEPSPPSFRICQVMQAPAPQWFRDGYGVGETVNIVLYKPGGHIDWHRDSMPERSEVVIVGLSDDYEGGELEYNGKRVHLASGDVVRFPVSTKHRVRTVVAGERMVAVGWVS